MINEQAANFSERHRRDWGRTTTHSESFNWPKRDFKFHMNDQLSADGVLEERDSWLLDQLEAAALFASLNQATDFKSRIPRSSLVQLARSHAPEILPT